MLTPRRAAFLGAVVGLVIYTLLLRPIVVGGIDVPLEQRVLLGIASLVVPVVAGALLGYLAARAVKRR